MAKAKKRSIVYIDGFNLYYGAVRGGPHKWLNLQRYFELLRPDDDIQAIKYFSALIDGPTRSNQDAYLLALETLPAVEVILGKFKAKQILCRHLTCAHVGDRRFASKEEKRTDVNLAIHLLNDGYRDVCDNFVIVSGDSDLVPAVNMLKTLFPAKQVIVYVPARNEARGAAVELRGAADKDRTLPQNILPKAQFPASIPDGSGGAILKPAAW
jgi:6-hydroxy-3-succinoylpyridine 3-monooxygenase